MPVTSAFKSGNSQAVRIPAELAYEATVELTISRYVITLAPARGSLKEAVALRRELPKPAEVETREPIPCPSGAATDWLAHRPLSPSDRRSSPIPEKARSRGSAWRTRAAAGRHKN